MLLHMNGKSYNEAKINSNFTCYIFFLHTQCTHVWLYFSLFEMFYNLYSYITSSAGIPEQKEKKIKIPT